MWRNDISTTAWKMTAYMCNDQKKTHPHCPESPPNTGRWTFNVHLQTSTSSLTLTIWVRVNMKTVICVVLLVTSGLRTHTSLPTSGLVPYSDIIYKPCYDEEESESWCIKLTCNTFCGCVQIARPQGWVGSDLLKQLLYIH